MQYDVSRIDTDYHFNITGVSYIGNPRSNTVMYIGRKIAEQLKKLESVEQCLVFAEKGIEVPVALRKKHAILLVENPQLEYAKLAIQLERMQAEEDKKYRYSDSEESHISETAVIGAGAYIEPGCFIGHHVIIGGNAVLLKGTVVKNAVIGDRFLANEYAVIGANGFTIAEDEEGNKVRIPSLGRVIIGNDVEVGAHNNVSRGSGGDTVLDDYVKLDAFVHIGHDAHLMKNVEVTAGGIVGGYDTVGEKAFLGLNAALRNRIEIGDRALLGMGAVVTKSVAKDTVVAGNPAKMFRAVSGGNSLFLLPPLKGGGMRNRYFVHESSYIDENVEIGEGTKIWHFCHIQSGAKIGKNCSLGQNVNVANNVVIGDFCKIQNNVSLYEGVELEDGVFCGPSCVFTNDLTPRAEYPKGHKNYKKTFIKRGASIGANATIVCGHTIGRYAMVAAGAVVTGDVPDYALVAGVPARIVGYVDEKGYKVQI